MNVRKRVGKWKTRFVVWLNSLQVVCKLAYLAWSQTCALACEREVHKFENSWKLTLFMLCISQRKLSRNVKTGRVACLEFCGENFHGWLKNRDRNSWKFSPLKVSGNTVYKPFAINSCSCMFVYLPTEKGMQVPHSKFINTVIPNQPSLGAITFTEEAITLSWTIERHELRSVHEYNITIESIQVRSPPPSIRDSRTARSSPVRINRQAANGQGDRKIKRHQYTVTKANCKTDLSSERAVDNCEYTVDQTIERETAYNVIMCAGNEFASVCDESGFTIPVIVTATTRGRKELMSDTAGYSKLRSTVTYCNQPNYM